MESIRCFPSSASLYIGTNSTIKTGTGQRVLCQSWIWVMIQSWMAHWQQWHRYTTMFVPKMEIMDMEHPQKFSSYLAVVLSEVRSYIILRYCSKNITGRGGSHGGVGGADFAVLGFAYFFEVKLQNPPPQFWFRFWFKKAHLQNPPPLTHSVDTFVAFCYVYYMQYTMRPLLSIE